MSYIKDILLDALELGIDPQAYLDHIVTSKRKLKTMRKLVYRPVTPKVVDVFFGQEGWEPKEHVRMFFSKQTKAWEVTFPRPYTYPEENFIVQNLEDVLPEIIKGLTNGNRGTK